MEVTITDLFLLFLNLLFDGVLSGLDLISRWGLCGGIGLLLFLESFRLGLVLVNLDLFLTEVY
jgi:hypothetical protein